MRYVLRSSVIDTRNVRALRIDFARSRVGITGAEIRTSGSSECAVPGCRVHIVDSSALIAQFAAESIQPRTQLEVHIDVAYGRAIPAFATLFAYAEDASVKKTVTRPTDAHFEPDWIASDEQFEKRFGVVGSLRRRALEIPIELVVVPDHIADLLAAVKAEPFLLSLFDVDASRRAATEIQCKIAKYFRFIEYYTTEPGAGTDTYPAMDLFIHVRQRLVNLLNDRAVHGAADALWTPEALSTSSADFVSLQIAAITRIFRDAENELPTASEVPDVTPFEWAYELFVAGRLAVSHPRPKTHWKIMHHGAPDGTPFLLFAELAALAIRVNHPDAPFWRERLPALVRAAVLFQAHPASDLAQANQYGINGKPPEDHYAFYDGKTIPLRVVFELRARHRAHLAGKSSTAALDALDRAFTWVAGKSIATTGSSLTPPIDPLDRPLELFLPTAASAP